MTLQWTLVNWDKEPRWMLWILCVHLFILGRGFKILYSCFIKLYCKVIFKKKITIFLHSLTCIDLYLEVSSLMLLESSLVVWIVFIIVFTINCLILLTVKDDNYLIFNQVLTIIKTKISLSLGICYLDFYGEFWLFYFIFCFINNVFICWFYLLFFPFFCI